MLRIPAGSFEMGAPETEAESIEQERPVHRVTLGEFLLGQTPITQAQWRAVAEWKRLGNEPVDRWPESLDPDPVAKLTDPERFRGEQRPIVNVSWFDAQAFCKRLALRTGKNYTLPSEAQWEYACRAGTTTPFHYGATINTELANYNGRVVYRYGDKGEYRQQTTDVASFPANYWHYNYEEAPIDERAWVGRETDQNQNVNKIKVSANRLLRGGSWGSNPRGCRSAYRDYNLPDGRSDYIGFRVCCLPQD
jgi:formylglycine-generating enzyme required for sulfatase activity